jgi:hypothetical protein
MPHSGHGGQQDPKYNCKYPHRPSRNDRRLTSLPVTSDSFSYNFSDHDQLGHSQDASGPTLMNHEQQSYLNDFFEHPDQISTNNMDNDVIPYNFAGFEINDRSGMNALGLQMASHMGLGFGIGNSAVHMPVPSGSTPRYTSHMAPPQLSQFDASRGFDNFVHANEQTPNSQTPNHITHDDQAASALMSMSSHSQEQSQATAASGGSSWGDFNLGDASGIAGEQLHSPMAPNASSSGSNTTPLTPTFGDGLLNSGRAPSHAQFHQQSLMQQATQPASFAPVRHQSMHVERAGNHMFDSGISAWQTYQAQMDTTQSQRRPPIVQYGSDQNFNQQGYRAAIVPTPDDKYTNLLNIPLVNEVFQNTQTPFPTTQQAGVRGYDYQQRHSVPSSLQQLSSAALTLQHSSQQTNSPNLQPHNDQLLVARAMENLQGSQPSRKRRRSQDDGQVAGPYGQTVNSTNAPRRGPVVPKQETTNDNELYSTPTGSNNKRRRSNVRPGTASSTGSASPSTPAQPHAKASSSSKKKRAEFKQPRANLSDTQKRNNHIASEQKRRDAMKTNYEDLNRLVPSLQNGNHGMSRSEILQNSADYLDAVRIGNETAMATYGINAAEMMRVVMAQQAQEAGASD